MLSWPTWARNFNLQVAPDPLSSAALWTNVLASPQTNSNELILKVPLTGEARFFRLQQP
jgi:hypothetical protein